MFKFFKLFFLASILSAPSLHASKEALPLDGHGSQCVEAFPPRIMVWDRMFGLMEPAVFGIKDEEFNKTVVDGEFCKGFNDSKESFGTSALLEISIPIPPSDSEKKRYDIPFCQLSLEKLFAIFYDTVERNYDINPSLRQALDTHLKNIESAKVLEWAKPDSCSTEDRGKISCLGFCFTRFSEEVNSYAMTKKKENLEAALKGKQPAFIKLVDRFVGNSHKNVSNYFKKGGGVKTNKKNKVRFSEDQFLNIVTHFISLDIAAKDDTDKSQDAYHMLYMFCLGELLLNREVYTKKADSFFSKYKEGKPGFVELLEREKEKYLQEGSAPIEESSHFKAAYHTSLNLALLNRVLDKQAAFRLELETEGSNLSYWPDYLKGHPAEFPNLLTGITDFLKDSPKGNLLDIAKNAVLLEEQRLGELRQKEAQKEERKKKTGKAALKKAAKKEEKAKAVAEATTLEAQQEADDAIAKEKENERKAAQRAADKAINAAKKSMVKSTPKPQIKTVAKEEPSAHEEKPVDSPAQLKEKAPEENPPQEGNEERISEALFELRTREATLERAAEFQAQREADLATKTQEATVYFKKKETELIKANKVAADHYRERESILVAKVALLQEKDKQAAQHYAQINTDLEAREKELKKQLRQFYADKLEFSLTQASKDGKTPLQQYYLLDDAFYNPLMRGGSMPLDYAGTIKKMIEDVYEAVQHDEDASEHVKRIAAGNLKNIEAKAAATIAEKHPDIIAPIRFTLG